MTPDRVTHFIVFSHQQTEKSHGAARHDHQEHIRLKAPHYGLVLVSVRVPVACRQSRVDVEMVPVVVSVPVLVLEPWWA